MKNTTSIKIPKKYEAALELVEKDADGYWAYTNHGWHSPDMECHTMHEDTQAALLEKIRRVKPCDCEDCKAGLADEEAEQEETPNRKIVEFVPANKYGNCGYRFSDSKRFASGKLLADDGGKYVVSKGRKHYVKPELLGVEPAGQ